jgi:hypothetical protein
VLGLKTLHVEVSEPAVPQYSVALCSQSYTRVGTMRPSRGGAGVRFLLLWEQIKSVAGSFSHTHSCGHHEQSMWAC